MLVTEVTSPTLQNLTGSRLNLYILWEHSVGKIDDNGTSGGLQSASRRFCGTKKCLQPEPVNWWARARLSPPPPQQQPRERNMDEKADQGDVLRSSLEGWSCGLAPAPPD